MKKFILLATFALSICSIASTAQVQEPVKKIIPVNGTVLPHGDTAFNDTSMSFATAVEGRKNDPFGQGTVTFQCFQTKVSGYPKGYFVLQAQCDSTSEVFGATLSNYGTVKDKNGADTVYLTANSSKIVTYTMPYPNPYSHYRILYQPVDSVQVSTVKVYKFRK